MVQNNSERQVAFGRNSVETKDGEVCDCPAKLAGFVPDEGIMFDVVSDYDYQMIRTADKTQGTVDEETAKEVWVALIERYESRDLPEANQLRENARKVAAELEWL